MRKSDFNTVVNCTPVIVPIFRLVRPFKKFARQFHLKVGDEVYVARDGGIVAVKTGTWYANELTPGYLKFVEYRGINKAAKEVSK